MNNISTQNRTETVYLEGRHTNRYTMLTLLFFFLPPYWNRTNILCFEDSSTNRYTKGELSTVYYIYIIVKILQVKRLELLCR